MSSAIKFSGRRVTVLSVVFGIGAIVGPTVANADFNYNNFTDTSGITFVGNGHQANNLLRLSAEASAGWYTTKQSVAAGFTTTFAFQAFGSNDGFAFVIQNQQVNAMGGRGGQLGYADRPGETVGIANCIAQQFDYYRNLVGDGGIPSGDPSDNWTSLQTRGLLPNSADIQYSLGWNKNIPDINNNATHTVRISYLPGSWTVWMDDLVTPKLMINLNLASTLSMSDGRAWIGFTGAAGDLGAHQDILSWQFNSVPEPSSAVVLVGMGLGALRLRKRSTV
jgi:hypothetical protein